MGVVDRAERPAGHGRMNVWLGGLGFWYFASPPFAASFGGFLSAYSPSARIVESSNYALFLAFLTGFAFVGVFRKRLNPLRERLGLLTLCSILIATAMLLAAFYYTGQLEAWGLFAAAVLRGFSGAVMMLAWIELLGVLDGWTLGTSISLSIAIYGLLCIASMLVATWSAPVFAVFAAVAPLLSMLFLFLGWQSISSPSRYVAIHEKTAEWKVSALLVCGNVFYGVLFGVMRRVVDETPFPLAVFLGFAIAAMGLAFVFSRMSRSVAITSVMRVVLLPSAVACPLAAIINVAQPMLATVLIAVGLACQTFFVCATFADISLRYPASPLAIGSICGTSFALGIAAGLPLGAYAIRGGVLGWQYEIMLLTVAMLAASLQVAIIFLPGNRQGISPWGFSTLLVPEPFDERLLHNCEKIAAAYGLTAREKEVLALLAKGHNLEYIQRLLVISQNTAKTHILHVYQKTAVHSRQELMDLVEAG